jgi:hypothetical protein
VYNKLDTVFKTHIENSGKYYFEVANV